MIIDKPCLSVEEIKQRRFDLRTVANVSQEAEDISAVLEEDLIPGAIANELAEVGYCILYSYYVLNTFSYCYNKRKNKSSPRCSKDNWA